MPTIPGYTIYEQRRPNSKRGGIAIAVRKGLHIVRTVGNEFAQLVELKLPAGTHLAVVNIYMPPVASVVKKHHTEETV